MFPDLCCSWISVQAIPQLVLIPVSSDSVYASVEILERTRDAGRREGRIVWSYSVQQIELTGCEIQVQFRTGVSVCPPLHQSLDNINDAEA